MTDTETSEQEEGAKWLMLIVLADLQAFEKEQGRELMHEERMAFLDGHFRGFVFGRKVAEATR